MLNASKVPGTVLGAEHGAPKAALTPILRELQSGGRDRLQQMTHFISIGIAAMGENSEC